MLGHLRQHSSPELKAHTGYYYEYYHAMTEPGSILCSLVHVCEDGSDIVYERNECLQIAGAEGEFERYRYIGFAYYLRDRLFLIDYESLTSNEISQTILIPSFKSCITRLNGLKWVCPPLTIGLRLVRESFGSIWGRKSIGSMLIAGCDFMTLMIRLSMTTCARDSLKPSLLMACL